MCLHFPAEQCEDVSSVRMCSTLNNFPLPVRTPDQNFPLPAGTRLPLPALESPRCIEVTVLQGECLHKKRLDGFLAICNLSIGY